jgi:hypothetical protein
VAPPARLIRASAADLSRSTAVINRPHRMMCCWSEYHWPRTRPMESGSSPNPPCSHTTCSTPRRLYMFPKPAASSSSRYPIDAYAESCSHNCKNLTEVGRRLLATGEQFLAATLDHPQRGFVSILRSFAIQHQIAQDTTSRPLTVNLLAALATFRHVGRSHVPEQRPSPGLLCKPFTRSPQITVTDLPT